jgi:hypothetical protein
MPTVVCIGCGCTNDNPCLNLAGQACYWSAVEPAETVPPGEERVGLCTFCAAKPLGDLIDKMARRVTV